MEDLNAYIESGVLELYAMGDLSSAERLEVERMLSKYPQLKAELNEIERALELYAGKHAVEPPESLRSNILDQLQFNEESNVKHISQPLKNEQVYTSQSNFYKYAFAASVALLLISVAALINLSNRLQESNQRIAVLETSNQKFSSQVNYFEKELGTATAALEVYQKPEQFKMVELKGLPKAPDAKMMVAFNPRKEMVMIDMKSMKMPETDKEHEYQLWALVDGKPVDLGVFNAQADSIGMIKMKNVKNAQAFAVTLEPKGGSVNPTMEQMIAMGNI